jgi:hypothetical protein
MLGGLNPVKPQKKNVGWVVTAWGIMQRDAGVAVAASPQLVHCSWPQECERCRQGKKKVLKVRIYISLLGRGDIEQKSNDGLTGCCPATTDTQFRVYTISSALSVEHIVLILVVERSSGPWQCHVTTGKQGAPSKSEI